MRLLELLEPALARGALLRLLRQRSLQAAQFTAQPQARRRQAEAGGERQCQRDDLHLSRPSCR